MLWHTILAVASLLAKCSQAYSPIQMVSGQGKGFVVLPKVSPGNIRGALIPQRLSVRNVASNDPTSLVPHFTAKLDQTIHWDDVDWCLEATGNKPGDAVRVNICSGAQTQKWIWLPDERGHNMVQLRDTELCLDATAKEGGSNGVPIELRGCGSEVSQWQFGRPLSLSGASQSDEFSSVARHAMIIVLTLVGLWAVSLGVRGWQPRATANEDQKTFRSLMNLDTMQPSRVAQTHASRTSNISLFDAGLEAWGLGHRGAARCRDASCCGWYTYTHSGNSSVAGGIGTRTLGVDFGLRRTGFAISCGFAPIPLGILESNWSKDFPRLSELLVRAARDEDAEQIVLGMPYNSSGEEGHQCAITRQFGQVLAQMAAPIPVFLWDERFSSAIAQQRMHAGKGYNAGDAVDAVAAVIILEEFFAGDPATAHPLQALPASCEPEGTEKT